MIDSTKYIVFRPGLMFRSAAIFFNTLNTRFRLLDITSTEGNVYYVPENPELQEILLGVYYDETPSDILHDWLVDNSGTLIHLGMRIYK